MINNCMTTNLKILNGQILREKNLAKVIKEEVECLKISTAAEGNELVGKIIL